MRDKRNEVGKKGAPVYEYITKLASAISYWFWVPMKLESPDVNCLKVVAKKKREWV